MTPAQITRAREFIQTPRRVDGNIAECADLLDKALVENAVLKAALTEALDGWEYNAQYKGAYFIKKHGDAEDITRLRALCHKEII